MGTLDCSHSDGGRHPEVFYMRASPGGRFMRSPRAQSSHGPRLELERRISNSPRPRDLGLGMSVARLALVAILGSLLPDVGRAQVTIAWEEMEPPPSSRLFNSDLVNSEGFLYTFETSSQTDTTANGLRYDVQADSWEFLGPLPFLWGVPRAAESNGLIYVSGPRALVRSQEVFSYDPRGDIWSPVAPLGQGRDLHAFAATLGRVYAISGVSGCSGSCFTEVSECYEVGSGLWNTVPPIPTPRGALSAVAESGLVYVVGGYDTSSGIRSLPDLEIFDTSTYSWVRGPDMPTPRSAPGVTLLDGRMFVVGGSQHGGPADYLDTVEVLDLASGVWDPGTPLPLPLRTAAMVTVGCELWVMGSGPIATEGFLFRGTLGTGRAIQCDIKPGSDPNSINPDSRGVIPVAILGSQCFDVLRIDVSTVTFGPNRAVPAHRVGVHMEDVNADLVLDAVFHFWTRDTGIEHGDTEACISWSNLSGEAFTCCDDIRTVPPTRTRKGASSSSQRGPRHQPDRLRRKRQRR